MSIYLGNKKLAGLSVKQSHNIGDIFFTKRTDTFLAGAVECNGATYQTTSYTGEGSIGELLSAGKLDYVSLTAYATEITAKGFCKHIGWDGTGTTSFRVPTISPRHYIVKTQEPTASNNYTWYRLYADSWVEQGGLIPQQTSTDITITLPVEMLNEHYHWGLSCGYNDSSATVRYRNISCWDRTTTSFSVRTDTNFTKSWQVSGMSTITPESASRVMIQLYNAVTDEALATCENVESDVAELKSDVAELQYDYVVNFQRPTAANNYTWYRKYKSGWVEQGGITSNFTNTAASSGQSKTVVLPIAMSDTRYTVNASMCSDLSLGNGSVSGYANRVIKPGIMTTTGFTIEQWTNAGSAGTSVIACWQVSGMAA